MKVFDKNAVARHLDLTPKRVKQLTDKGILKEYRPGLYELGQARVDYIRYLRNQNPETEESIDYQTERAKLVRAKRKNEEMELAVKSGELHRAEDIERVMSAMLINFKARLMAIPAEQAPKLAGIKEPDKISRIIMGEVRKALLELSDFRTLFCGDVKEDEERND
ncbi:MAG: hypothetical protein NC331_13885 [Lachnospiraceae bacterium]|nr:hypothetical protein [Lachnospiraceae bacterium]MCM1240455.1 hypothetical protein [Lachnospiraceae bacterium]